MRRLYYERDGPELVPPEQRRPGLKYVWLVLVLAPGWLEPELLLELEQVLVPEPELSWSWWLREPSVELLCSPS